MVFLGFILNKDECDYLCLFSEDIAACLLLVTTQQLSLLELFHQQCVLLLKVSHAWVSPNRVALLDTTWCAALANCSLNLHSSVILVNEGRMIHIRLIVTLVGFLLRFLVFPPRLDHAEHLDCQSVVHQVIC